MIELLDEIPVEQRAIAESAEANGRHEVKEPLVYGFGSERSYYADRMLVEKKDTRAGERLEKHDRQMKRFAREGKGKREQRALAGVEYRYNPTTTTGHGLEFTPPLWLNELFAVSARPGQIVQRLAPTFDLPPGVSSVNLTRITSGTQADTQTPGTPVDDKDVETAEVKSPAVTFSGLSDWSIQAFEQSPQGSHLDWVVFTDLTSSVDNNVEKSIINGYGPNLEEFYGLVNLPSITKTTYTSATPEGTKMFTAIGETLAQVGVKRKRPPEAILMNTSRFFWLATSQDKNERPLLLEDYPFSDFPNAGLSSVGVYMNDAITNKLGASGEEDVVIACRPSEFVILASEPKTSVKLDVLSGTLTARFEMHRYMAILLGRYPSSTAVLSGTGMKPATGYK